MNKIDRQTSLAHNVRRLGHLDLAGAGQVTVCGLPRLCRAHPEQGPSRHHHHRHLGSEPIRASSPPSRSTITTSHSHKVRVAGDIMIVNHERNMSKIGRRAEQLPAARRALADELGREPTRAEIAAQAERDRGRPARARGSRAARLSQRRLQDLRRLQPGAAQARSAIRRPAASACTASTWTSATPTSRPRWRAISATSSSSTTCAIRNARRKSRAGG